VYEYDGGSPSDEPVRVTELRHVLPSAGQNIPHSQRWRAYLEWQVTCQPINPYRTEWSIGLSYVTPGGWRPLVRLCPCWESGPTASKLFQYTFDVLESRIRLRRYSLPLVTRNFASRRLERPQSWVEQAESQHVHLLPGPLGDQAVATDWGMDRLDPLWPDADDMAERRLARARQVPAQARYPSPFTAETQRIGLVYGDDDFTVLLGHRGYVLWDFRRRTADMTGPLFEAAPAQGIVGEWGGDDEDSDERFAMESRLGQLHMHGLVVARCILEGEHVHPEL